jgi:homocysteine S-methyltransferase
VAILDGGLATELEARGHEISDELWSARLLIDDPDSIRRLHLDYLEAGADCIVSAGYQASIPGFQRIGLDEAEAEQALRRAVQLALEAREEFWARASSRVGRVRPLVAAGLGPYGAYQADGSEYTGDYDLDVAGLTEFHRNRLRVTAEAGADLLAFETIPSLAEARALVSLLERLPGHHAWISFSCRNGREICDGTPWTAALDAIQGCGGLIALGINCTAPRHLDALIREARRHTDLPIVAYPNSGEVYDAARKCWLDGDSRLSLDEAAPSWVDLGASLVGGCCRTGVADVHRLRQRLLPEGAAPQST